MTSTPNPTVETPTVRHGQVWADNDKRSAGRKVRVISEDELAAILAAHLGDDAHTLHEKRAEPGVYRFDPQGHTLLVGTNDRALVVLDMGGMAQIAGVDVWDPDHLRQFADRVRMVADRLARRKERRREVDQ